MFLFFINWELSKIKKFCISLISYTLLDHPNSIKLSTKLLRLMSILAAVTLENRSNSELCVFDVCVFAPLPLFVTHKRNPQKQKLSPLQNNYNCARLTGELLYSDVYFCFSNIMCGMCVLFLFNSCFFFFLFLYSPFLSLCVRLNCYWLNPDHKRELCKVIIIIHKVDV